MAGRSIESPRDPAEGSREVIERELERQARQQERQGPNAKPGPSNGAAHRGTAAPSERR
ncbi:MAG TPA: hypothetical protein VF274_02560 [Alphaproteobacteria bacterium]|jgi:hypothetical protein